MIELKNVTKIYGTEKCQLEHSDGRERGDPRQIWFWKIDADACHLGFG